MDSSSISHRTQTRYLLRLRDLDEGSLSRYVLYEGIANTASIDLAQGGAVVDNHHYEVQILSDKDLGEIKANIQIEDSELPRVPVLKQKDLAIVDDVPMTFYVVHFDEIQQLFKMTFGFVRIEITLLSNDKEEKPVTLSTKDIPCLCTQQGHAKAVSNMLEELSSMETTKASTWMLSPSMVKSRFSLLSSNDMGINGEKGKFEQQISPISTKLNLAEQILNAYDNNLAFFRKKAHSVIESIDIVAPVSKVREIRRQDVDWLSQNAQLLHKVNQQSGIKIGNSYYLPAKMGTNKKISSTNNYENQVVLTFLKSICDDIDDIFDLIEKSLNRAALIQQQLAEYDKAEGILPSLIVARASVERQKPLLVKAQNLKQRSKMLCRSYSQLFNDVPTLRHLVLRMTKVFQEIRPYNEIYNTIKKWMAAGSVSGGQQGMALETFRSDKLYEYYTLLKLLVALETRGFLPRQDQKNPITLYNYNLKDRFFSNETQVANVYQLENNKWTCTLYYQPVFYGDAREEAGISLHRTTSAGGAQPYYTPDFLLAVKSKEKAGFRCRNIVLDSKFTTFEIANEKKKLEECLRKYKYETASSVAGGAVDSVWLLCGREENSLIEEEMLSSWAISQGNYMPSGKVALGPSASAINKILSFMDDEEGESVISEKAFAPKERRKTQEKITYSVVDIEQPVTALEKIIAEKEDTKLEPESKQVSKKPEKGAIKEDEIIELVQKIAGTVSSLDDFYNASFSLNEFSFEQPLLKHKRPGSTLAKLYTKKSVSVSGQKVYVYKAWSEQSFEKVNTWVKEHPVVSKDNAGKDKNQKQLVPKKQLKPVTQETPELTEEIQNLIIELAKTTFDKDVLYDTKYAHDTFGFEHALLRKTAPSSAEKRFYTREMYSIEGKAAFVFKKWRKDGVAKLQKVIDANLKSSKQNASATLELPEDMGEHYTAKECEPLRALESQGIFRC